MKKSKITRVLPIIIAVLIAVCMPASSNACVLLYSGGDNTEDGSNMFMRTEEIGADDNKIYYVSPAGKHSEGEEYQGCTDFTWTFTHDSYKYTARCDGKLYGMCPTCESKHQHSPYEEAGTNDHGVTVSATQSLNGNKKIQKVDPYTDKGIEESEMATVLLSEAATARDGVELLTSIYDSVGAAYEGAGTMICDQYEQWYVESLSGHEYIAVLLPSNVTFMQFNLSVLGEIDLDDTENVIASEHIFDVAKKAGTFVGDEENNIIDYRASYNDYLQKIVNEDWPEDWNTHVRERLAASQNFLEETDDWTSDNVLEDNHFVMTNIDENGKVVPLYNNLDLKNTISHDYAMEIFKVYPIGYEENVNTHMYHFYPEEEQIFGTTEWFAMDNCTYNVFVPSYPMLLTDTWEGYKVELGETEITDRKPEKGDYYVNDGEYHIHPEGWDKSYIGTLSALTNLLIYGELSDEETAITEDNFQYLQNDFETRFEELSKSLNDESSIPAQEKMMTESNMEMASEVHDMALALYRYYTYGAESELIQVPDNIETHMPVLPIIICILIALCAIAAISVFIVKRRQKK